MFCSQCGNELRPGSRFCPNCGAPVQDERPASPVQQTAATAAAAPAEKSAPAAASAPVQESAPAAATAAAPVQENAPAETSYAPDNYDYKTLPTEKEKGIRSIYVLDFMLRMTGKANIPLFIYLILNVLIIGVVASLFLALPIGWGILAGFLIYAASVTVALSPIGEFILRSQNGCRKIEEKEVVDRIAPLFHEVYYKAKKKNPMLSNDIRLFINDDESPNAFATGRKTICVTRGLMSLGDEEIKATLGHEFGHLAHKDTDRILVVAIGNTAITAICMLFQIGVIISNVMVSIFAAFLNDDDGFIVSIFNAIATFISLFFVRGFMKVWTMLGVALCMKTSRGNEYQADEFSFRLGYGDGLCSMLGGLGGGEKPKGLFASLASSHPRTEDRIARLQALAAQNQVQEQEG